MWRECDFKKVGGAAERFVAGVAVDEQDIELIAHLHDGVEGVVVGEAVAFEADGERMVADFLKRMGEREHGLAFWGERNARGAQASAVGFEVYGHILPGALAVVFDADTQTDGLGFSGDERGDVGAGDAEVLGEITADTEEGDLRFRLLFGEAIQCGQGSTVGDGAPIGFLEIGDDDDFACGIGRVL